MQTQTVKTIPKTRCKIYPECAPYTCLEHAAVFGRSSSFQSTISGKMKFLSRRVLCPLSLEFDASIPSSPRAESAPNFFGKSRGHPHSPWRAHRTRKRLPSRRGPGTAPPPSHTDRGDCEQQTRKSANKEESRKQPKTGNRQTNKQTKKQRNK